MERAKGSISNSMVWEGFLEEVTTAQQLQAQSCSMPLPTSHCLPSMKSQ